MRRPRWKEGGREMQRCRPHEGRAAVRAVVILDEALCIAEDLKRTEVSFWAVTGLQLKAL